MVLNAHTGANGPRRPAGPPTAPGVIAAKVVVHLLALAPLAWLAWRTWQVVGGADIDALGADPIVAIEHETGIGALRLLLITLAISPLRQLTGAAVLLLASADKAKALGLPAPRMPHACYWPAATIARAKRLRGEGLSVASISRALSSALPWLEAHSSVL